MGRCEKSGCETKGSSGREVAQQVMALAAKANDRSLFLWTHSVEGENCHLETGLWLPQECPGLRVQALSGKGKENYSLTQTCVRASQKEGVFAILHVC